MKFIAIAALLLGFSTATLRAEDMPTTQSSDAGSIIAASDKDAIAAVKDKEKDVTVEGKIVSAKWSASGKVMNIKFADSDLLVAVFEKNKDKLNEQFSGDLGKALTGAKVKIKGKIEVYKGKNDALKDKPQIIISQGSQITIEDAAATTQKS